MTLPATLFVPEFLFLEHEELRVLLHVLRDPLATHVHMLLLTHSNFATGEFLGGYHRLMELCTPPQPERGKRRPGPSFEQLRRVVRDLIEQGLALRNAAANAAQGQLRLQLKPRDQKSSSSAIHNRKDNRDAKGPKPVSMRVAAASGTDSAQDKTQGYQEGINTPISPQSATYPQSPVNPEAKKAGIAALKALKGSINRPPEGAQKAPRGGRGGQVALSALMPAMACAGSTMKQPSISKEGNPGSLKSGGGKESGPDSPDQGRRGFSSADRGYP
jgi:hypothetical protein